MGGPFSTLPLSSTHFHCVFFTCVHVDTTGPFLLPPSPIPHPSGSWAQPRPAWELLDRGLDTWKSSVAVFSSCSHLCSQKKNHKASVLSTSVLSSS